MSTILTFLNELVAANKAYRAGKPVLTDADYDAKEDELRMLVDLCEEDDADPDVVAARAFLASIGTVPDGKWVKTTHRVRMTSLNKAQDSAEFLRWFSGCASSGPYVVSDKCDGASINLWYEGGSLIKAVTRGDGDVGEDITRNVLKMKGTVHTIKGFDGEIRGEIVLLKSDWKTHFPTYTNPRNAAVGIAMDEDGEGAQHLTVLHYQMLRKGQPIPRKSVEFQALAAVGCAVPMFTVVPDAAGVQAIYDAYVAGRRAALDYDIDGLVVELESVAAMESLGELNHRPRGAVAYKFPADAKQTTLRNVRWQVGKSGRVTPVAEFDPVQLAGAMVERASLHNLARVAKLCADAGVSHLSVGDTVVASRRGDVIPFCEELLSANGGSPLLPPVSCPECDFPLTMSGEYLVCRGEDCPAQVLGGISRWVQKIGVLGFGDSIIEALIDQAGVTDAADLYALDPVKCESITLSSGSRLGRTAHIVLDELKAKSEVPLHVFVGSLGIPLCARSVCKAIVDAGFDSLEKMEAATVAQIAAIPGMGSGKAGEFVSGFETRRTLMDKLLDYGVTIKAKSVGVLTGKSVCFTGVRSPEMEKAIEEAGGTLKSSVGAGLTYLVQRDAGSQSGKSQKAKQLGVRVVDLDGMWAILGRPQGGSQPVQLTAARAPRSTAAVAQAPTPPPQNGILDLFGSE